MRKLGILFLTIIMGITLIACGNGEIRGTKQPVETDIKPVRSFGNQINQRFLGRDYFFIESEHEIYAISSNPAGHDRIVKLNIDEPKNQKTIFEGNAGDSLHRVTAFGDWIYFVVAIEERGKRQLFRIKKDGGKKVEILDGTANLYALTETEIYYQRYVEPIEEEKDQICAMKLDGSEKRKILEGTHLLIGIDNGWIYYYEETNGGHDSYLHRIRPDGSGKESVPDMEEKDGDNFFNNEFIVEKDHLFFTRSYYDDTKKDRLIKKVINGTETTLTTGSFLTILNKEGDWIFYGDRNKVYKIKADGKGKKQLIYRFEEKNNDGLVDRILLNDGDIFVMNQANKCVYIKQDGTVVDLGKIK